LYEHTPK